MESPAARRASMATRRREARVPRVAFVGPRVWLDGCVPPAQTRGLRCASFATAGGEPDGVQQTLDAVHGYQPDACLVFDPCSLGARFVGELPGAVLGFLVGSSDPSREPESARAAERERVATLGATLARLDRLVSFSPALGGTAVEGSEVWRSVPAPVSDLYYHPVRRLAGPPRAMSIGRSTRYREHRLLASKHHHDLLQVIHGVSGPPLAELLAEHDVGVYVPARAGGGYGHQVGIHLAAGQLLFSEPLEPAHGLEVDVDFLQFDSPEGLVWSLERMASFPEMYKRVCVRGRMKAEQYRSSRLLPRLVHDLLADVAAFG